MGGTLREGQYRFLIISPSCLLRIKNISYKTVEKIKSHVLGSITFCRKYCPLLDNVVKYCREGQATDDNTPHAHGMLDI